MWCDLAGMIYCLGLILYLMQSPWWVPGWAKVIFAVFWPVTVTTFLLRDLAELGADMALDCRSWRRRWAARYRNRRLGDP